MSEKDQYDAILNLKKSIRFLEDKINVEISLNRDKFDLFDDCYKGLFADSSAQEDKIKLLREQNRALNQESSISREKQFRLEARIEQLEAFIGKKCDEDKKAFSSVHESLEKRKDFEMNMLEDVDMLDKEMQPIKRQSNEMARSLGSLMKEMNEMKNVHDEDKKSSSQLCMNQVAESKALMELIEKRVDDQHRIIENVDQMVLKSDQRVKENLASMSKVIEDSFSDHVDYVDSVIKDLKSGKLSFMKKLDHLENDMLKAMKQDRSGRKEEMAMKQARINADKILIIEQFLEEM